MILQLYLNHTSDGSMQPCSNTNFFISFSVGGMMNGWAKTLTTSCAIMGLAFLFAKTHTGMHGHNEIHAVASGFKKHWHYIWWLHLQIGYDDICYLQVEVQPTNLIDCINCEVINLFSLLCQWKLSLTLQQVEKILVTNYNLITASSSSILQPIPSALPSC